MSKDPYGNDVVDPFDQAIADAVMRSTWWSAGGALGLSLSSTCCCVGTGAVQLTGIVVIGIVTLLALVAVAASLNVMIRVFTMQPEHKSLVPSWAPWGALGMGIAAFLIASGQLLVTVGPFLMLAVLNMIDSLIN